MDYDDESLTTICMTLMENVGAFGTRSLTMSTISFSETLGSHSGQQKSSNIHKLIV